MIQMTNLSLGSEKCSHPVFPGFRSLALATIGGPEDPQALMKMEDIICSHGGLATKEELRSRGQLKSI